MTVIPAKESFPSVSYIYIKRMYSVNSMLEIWTGKYFQKIYYSSLFSIPLRIPEDAVLCTSIPVVMGFVISLITAEKA